MKRSTLNFAIDAATLVVMLAMIATGLLVRFILPPGSGERRVLWEYSRHDWGDVHFWLAVALGGLVFVHIALHWSWICSLVLSWVPHADSSIKRKSEIRRNLAGAALMIVVAGFVSGFLWIAAHNVVETDGGGRQLRRGQHASLITPAAHADEAASPAGTSSAMNDASAGDGIRVYYFHRTLRCHTCLTIESLARAAVHEHFSDGLAAGRITWQAVNIELPGNEHFERDFELQTQSLVLTEFMQGDCVRWKNLSEVWNLVKDEAAFASYVRNELAEFCGG